MFFNRCSEPVLIPTNKSDCYSYCHTVIWMLFKFILSQWVHLLRDIEKQFYSYLGLYTEGNGNVNVMIVTIKTRESYRLTRTQRCVSIQMTTCALPAYHHVPPLVRVRGMCQINTLCSVTLIVTLNSGEMFQLGCFHDGKIQFRVCL